VSVKWNTRAFESKIAAGLERNLDRAAEYLQSDIQKAFPGSGKQGATKKEREANRSKPGEIPHVQTGGAGGLKGSIRWERSGKGRRKIGSTIQPQGSLHSYPWYLEMGTLRMRGARPWLRVALKRNKQKLNKIIGKKVV